MNIHTNLIFLILSLIFTLIKVGKILEGYRANYKLKILTKYTKTIIKSFN